MTTAQRLNLLRALHHEIGELAALTSHQALHESVGVKMPTCVLEEAAQREERAVELFCTAFGVELANVLAIPA